MIPQNISSDLKRTEMKYNLTMNDIRGDVYGRHTAQQQAEVK